MTNSKVVGLNIDSTKTMCLEVGNRFIMSIHFCNIISLLIVHYSLKMFLKCVYGCFVCIYVCAAHACNACGGQKRASGPLTSVILYVGSRNQPGSSGRAVSALQH